MILSSISILRFTWTGIDHQSSKNAGHHFEATLNNERRKSLLRGLQQRRIERQLLLENLQETPERFLVSTASSLSRDKTAEFRLIPKIKIRCTKRVGTSERKRAKLGDAWRRDKTFEEVSSDTSEEATSISINDRLYVSHSQALTSVLEEPGMITMDKDFKLIYPPKALRLNITRFPSPSNAIFTRNNDVIGERLLQSVSVVDKKNLGNRKMEGETLRVLPVNPKLTIDTGNLINLVSLKLFPSNLFS